MFCRTTSPSLVLAALALHACQCSPPPLDLPSATLSVDYEPAQLHAIEEPSPGATQANVQARQALLLAVAETPIGTPVAMAAAAIISDRESPFRGKSQLPIGSRWLNAEQTRAWLAPPHPRTTSQQQQLATAPVVLRKDLVTSVQVSPAKPVPNLLSSLASGPNQATSPGQATFPQSFHSTLNSSSSDQKSSAEAALPKLPSLQLQFHDSHWRVLLTSDEARTNESSPTDSSRIGTRQIDSSRIDSRQIDSRLGDASNAASEREVLVIEETVAANDPIALFVPDPRLPKGGLLLLLLPRAQPTAELVAAANQTAQAKAPTRDVEDAPPMAWQVAQQAIGADNRRPALLAIVAPLHLQRCVDLILAADEPALITMTQQLARVDAKAEQVDWLVEIAMWLAVVPRIERDELTAAMQAACRRHLGALAEDAATLQLLLKVSQNQQAFAQSLQDENLAALADRSAAIRVSALRWLNGRNINVPGYDPMAHKSERRHAIRQFLATQEAGQ